ncbi:MAG TPA: YcxB family protein [Verrucomicrobiae bacterium]|jgi:hypothetical protein|nr:YcxB family protein [Verrucomicrobiae bacterium]
MEISYLLTWEEYAELFSNSWPRPDYFSAIVITMVSIPLIVYGIILAFFGMPDEHFLSWMFIGCPALLLPSAFLSMATGSKKAVKEAVAKRRAEYEKWHVKEQLFSFDQEKWTLRNESGKVEVPWSALVSANEWPAVFYLVSESGRAIVPKRALTMERVDLLRRLASLEIAPMWPFQMSVWDYQATETAQFWKRYWFRMAFGNVFGMVVLIWLLQTWFTSNGKFDIVWGWSIAGFVVVMTLTAQIWYLPLKYWTAPGQWRTPKGLGISDRGMCIKDLHTCSFHGWKSLPSFNEVGRSFLVYVNQSHYYLLAKHYFSEEQKKEIGGRLRANLKEKKVSG